MYGVRTPPLTLTLPVTVALSPDIQAQYGHRLKVHFAKKARGARKSVKYLGRYLQRPPVSRCIEPCEESRAARLHNADERVPAFVSQMHSVRRSAALCQYIGGKPTKTPDKFMQANNIFSIGTANTEVIIDPNHE